MTPAILNSIQKKNKLYRIVKKNTNNSLLKLDYKIYKNKLTSIIRLIIKQNGTIIPQKDILKNDLRQVT